MKKIATALVIVACLLTGALLPALAETDLSRPAAAEEPRMEEKTPGETELPAREETPKATDGREDRAASEAEPVAPRQRGHPRRPTGARTRPRLKKSRMPLKLRNLRSGMATTVRRIRTASGITAGRGSGPVRAQTCRAVPEQTSGAGPIAPAVRLAANVPAGKTTSPPKRCRPRFRSRNPARQRNPQRRRRFGWDPEWPSESQSGGKNAPPFFCPCYRIVNLL